jgi:hypothetical protein
MRTSGSSGRCTEESPSRTGICVNRDGHIETGRFSQPDEGCGVGLTEFLK